MLARHLVADRENQHRGFVARPRRSLPAPTRERALGDAVVHASHDELLGIDRGSGRHHGRHLGEAARNATGQSFNAS